MKIPIILRSLVVGEDYSQSDMSDCAGWIQPTYDSERQGLGGGVALLVGGRAGVVALVSGATHLADG